MRWHAHCTRRTHITHTLSRRWWRSVWLLCFRIKNGFSLHFPTFQLHKLIKPKRKNIAKSVPCSFFGAGECLRELKHRLACIAASTATAISWLPHIKTWNGNMEGDTEERAAYIASRRRTDNGAHVWWLVNTENWKRRWCTCHKLTIKVIHCHRLQ